MNKWAKKCAKWLLRFFPRFSAIAYSRRSYSQEGEDLILAGLIGDRPRGFYVDIGAHHPHRFSNTFYFYQRGWRGINVDPMVGMKSIFDKMRPRDINLQLGCAQMEGSASYHSFDDPAYNTMNAENLEVFRSRGFPRLLRTEVVPVLRLETILEKHLPAGEKITFLSVDVESFDFEVLKSNNWDRFKPELVIVEDSSGFQNQMTPLGEFLITKGYRPISRTRNNSIWSSKH